MSLDLVQGEKTSLMGLGTYKDFYLVQDMRDTNEEFTRKELRTPGNVVRYTFDIFSLSTDPNFQNRNEKYSEISVQRILHAVENGSFKWDAFDPIVIWQNPQDNKYYILSGHSRSEAFWRLAKMGAKAEGRGFYKIPARIFHGTYEEAKYFAQNSNTLSTKETTTERAGYFHKLLQIADGDKKQIAKIKEECKQAEGKEYKNVWALAHLSPEGAAFSLVKELEEKENKATVNGIDLGTKFTTMYPNYELINGKKTIVRNAENPSIYIEIPGWFINVPGKGYLRINDSWTPTAPTKKRLLEYIATEFIGNNPREWKFVKWVSDNPENHTAYISKMRVLRGLGDVENYNTALILAVWVGSLRAAFPQLTNDHENEIFYFLIRGGYPSKYKTYTELKDTISALVAARTDSDGNFNAAKKINIERSSEELTHEKQYQFELSELDKEIKKSESKYTKFLQELIKKHESDKNFSVDDYLKQLKEFLSAVIYDRRKKIQFEKKHGLYTQADRDQKNLFSFDGLGELPQSMRHQIAVGLRGVGAMRDPSFFNVPESELKCNGMKPDYIRLPDYSFLIGTPLHVTDFNGYGLKDTLPVLLSSVRESVPQVAKLAKHLQSKTPLQTMFNVWHWLHTNIKYNYDDKNKEQVRTAARSWADRQRGVDCDCLSVFTAAILINCGLNPKFEIVAFNGNPEFGHIYVICNGVVVDRVMGAFNKRPAFITKTKNMEIPVYNLRGCGMSSIDGLRGLQSDLLSKIQSGKATKRDKVDFKKARVLVSLEGDPVAYRAASMLMPYVVDVDEKDGGFYFDNPEIAGLAVHLDQELQRAEMAGLSGPELEGIFKKIGKAIKKAATSTVKAVANTTKAVVKATGNAVANVAKATTNVVKATANVVKAGAQAATGHTAAAKATMQKAGSQVATAAKATVQSVTKPTTTVVKSAVSTTKDVVKNTIVEPTKTIVSATGQLLKVIFVKINPVTVLMRNALRMLVAINFLGMATRLNIANMSESDALAKGFTKEDYDTAVKAKKRVVNFVVKMGGSKDKIEKAIVKGSGRKALFKKDYNNNQKITEDGDLAGLGEPVTIGSCLAAVGAFFAKIWGWIKNIAVKFFSSDAGKALVQAGVQKLADKVGGGSSSDGQMVTSDDTPINQNGDNGNTNGGGMSNGAKLAIGALIVGGILIATSGKSKKK